MSNFRGKIVVLNFWASWCTFCVQEMPDFERLNKELVDKILAVRINRAEPIEKQTEFLNSLPVKITYRSLLDSSDQVAKAYNTRVMPTTYFLN